MTSHLQQGLLKDRDTHPDASRDGSPDAGVHAGIPFNRPWHAENEANYLSRAHSLAEAEPVFLPRCRDWLTAHTGARSVHLTHSCTAALEMAAILANIRPGDEVIMPSFTFPSTANAFLRQGGVPVFVDIRPDTLNMDETRIEAALSRRTRAIVPMHYGGVACEMDVILEIAARHDLLVIEDAAQAIGATYKGKPLGTLGHLGTYSFHKTKNIQCGTGGALLINRDDLAPRAEIIAEKGTDVRAFQRGEIPRYTWRDEGSAFLMTELHAALLLAQLEEFQTIQERRRHHWDSYFHQLSPLQQRGEIKLPPASHTNHNAHVFPICLTDRSRRDAVQRIARQHGVALSTHYEPLHCSSAGRRLGRMAGTLAVTEDIAGRLLRMPLFSALTDSDRTRAAQILALALEESGATVPRSLPT